MNNFVIKSNIIIRFYDCAGDGLQVGLELKKKTTQNIK